jgi:hypothetical protein
MTEASSSLSLRTRFRTAMMLAIVADGLQVVLFPLFSEGAMSPADDILDVAVAAILFRLLGWHWEFATSFLGKVVPGVDLVPFWTLAVANVYRKARHDANLPTPVETGG